MKTKKLFLASALLMGMFAVSATSATKVQCGVTNAQITSYLQTCSHHHTVYSVSDIPGSCNSSANIDGGRTATVFVANGIVIGHSDSSGIQ